MWPAGSGSWFIGCSGAISFDHYIDRSGIGAPLERAGYADSGRFVAQIIYYLIVLMVLQLAFNVFGANPITDDPRRAWWRGCPSSWSPLR